MNNQTLEEDIDNILDSVYSAGAYVAEQRLNNNPTGTITSDRMYSAKLAIQSVIARECEKARIDELQRALSKAIEFYEYSVAPHRFAEPIKQSLEVRVDQDAVPTIKLIERIAELSALQPSNKKGK